MGEAAGQAGDILRVIVVHSISEVLGIKAQDIGDTITFGTKLNTDYIIFSAWGRFLNMFYSLTL